MPVSLSSFLDSQKMGSTFTKIEDPSKNKDNCEDCVDGKLDSTKLVLNQLYKRSKRLHTLINKEKTRLHEKSLDQITTIIYYIFKVYG